MKEHSRYVKRPGKQESDRVYVIQLTEAGRELYHTNYHKYRKLSPDVEAPKPDLET